MEITSAKEMSIGQPTKVSDSDVRGSNTGDPTDELHREW